MSIEAGGFSCCWQIFLVLTSLLYKRMPLTKVCPECCTNVNLRKSVCECGHCFTLKRKASVNATSLRKSKRIAKQVKRASESAYEIIIRQTEDHLETEGETLQQRQQGIELNAKKKSIRNR